MPPVPDTATPDSDAVAKVVERAKTASELGDMDMLGWDDLDLILASLAAQAQQIAELTKVRNAALEALTPTTEKLWAAETANAELRGRADLWNWLAQQVSLSLDWHDEPEEDPVWQVHRVSGGVNDREWKLIASGETPLAAVQAARAALLPQQPSGQGSEV